MTRNMIYQDILDLISPHSLGSSKDPAGWRVRVGIYGSAINSQRRMLREKALLKMNQDPQYRIRYLTILRF